jgi:hypothetical protein
MKLRGRLIKRIGSPRIGAGIGVAPFPLTVEDPQFRGALHPILAEYPLRQPTLFAVYLSRKLVPPKIRTFIDHLVEYISEIPLPVLLEKTNLETVPKPGVPEAALGRQRGSTVAGPLFRFTHLRSRRCLRKPRCASLARS